MKKILSSIKEDYTFSAVLTVVVGILITLFHSVAIDIVCIVIGIALFVLGTMNVIKYSSESTPENRLILLSGLVFCAIGIYIITRPDALQDFVAVAFGIYVIYKGIIDIQNAVRLKKSLYKYWWAALIISAVALIAGLVLIILKNKIIDSLALLLGIMLIVEGCLDIWVAVKVKKINE